MVTWRTNPIVGTCFDKNTVWMHHNASAGAS